MEISLFLARFLGLYLIITCAALLLHSQQIRNMIPELIHHPAMNFLLGVLAVISGLLLVLFHNLWVPDWRILITLVGWLALLKGLARLFYPEFIINLTNKLAEERNSYILNGINVLFFLIGIFLVYKGLGY